MTVRNISEAFRIREEELDNERTVLLNRVHRSYNKKEKQEALIRIREIERELGIEGIPYNSSAFGG